MPSITSPAAGPVLSVVGVSCTSTARLEVSLGEPWLVPQPQFLRLRWSTRGGPPIPDPSPREDSVFWAVLTFPRGQLRCT